MNKWTWTRNRNEEIWSNGREDSREAAIEAARMEIKSDNMINEELDISERQEKFYVGRCQYYAPPSPNADEIIEELYEKMCYEFSEDVVYDYLASITTEEEKLLQEKLDKAWDEWLEETEKYPDVFTIIDVEEVEV